MKLLAIAGSSLALVIMGCAATMPGPGHVLPGGLINVTVVPGSLANFDQRYAAFPDSFEIVGEVEGTSSNFNILGLFSFGNGGYIPAVQNALSVSGADGIINCMADIKSVSALSIFASSKTTVRGIGIKLK